MWSYGCSGLNNNWTHSRLNARAESDRLGDLRFGDEQVKSRFISPTRQRGQKSKVQTWDMKQSAETPQIKTIIPIQTFIQTKSTGKGRHTSQMMAELRKRL